MNEHVNLGSALLFLPLLAVLGAVEVNAVPAVHGEVGGGQGPGHRRRRVVAHPKVVAQIILQ